MRLSQMPDKSKAGAYSFMPLDLATASRSRLAEVAGLTARREEELIHLLAGPGADRCRSFGIFDRERLVGFQAFVYRPMRREERCIHSFRSEFTIALPELRGTGVFAQFYRWTLTEIRREFGSSSTYIWGETRHRGWLKYGFKMWKRYSFYQVRSPSGEAYPGLPQLAGWPYRRVAAAVGSMPLPKSKESAVERLTSLSHGQYERYAYLARPHRSRVSYDEAGFKARFEHNPFYAYEFWLVDRALIVVRVSDGWAMISDVLAGSAADYMDAIVPVIETHSRSVLQGNIMSEVRAPYFWINLRLGFVPFLGGGSFVEDNRTCPTIQLADIPLYESYGFGVPAAPIGSAA